MLVSDSIAANCSVAMLLLSIRSELQIWNIYLANFIIGFINAFQGPASAVVIGKVMPKEKLEQVSGMNSFSGNLVAYLYPVFATSLFAWGGLNLKMFCLYVVYAQNLIKKEKFLVCQHPADQYKSSKACSKMLFYVFICPDKYRPCLKLCFGYFKGFLYADQSLVNFPYFMVAHFQFTGDNEIISIAFFFFCNFPRPRVNFHPSAISLMVLSKAMFCI